jgi:hypothetical protein
MYMAYAKNKHSSNIHVSKARLTSSGQAPMQKIILVVIILAVLTVLAALIYSLLFNPERVVKSTISQLSNSYYEDYFYPNISGDASQALPRYTDTGLSKVTLRQLLLYDDQQTAKYQDLLSKYCDTNATYVQFYPTEPFGKSDYHTEFTYSCSF